MPKKVNVKDLAKASNRFIDLLKNIKIRTEIKEGSKKAKRDAKAAEDFSEGYKAGFISGLDFLAEMAKTDPEVWEVGMEPGIFLPFYSKQMGFYVARFIGKD